MLLLSRVIDLHFFSLLLTFPFVDFFLWPKRGIPVSRRGLDVLCEWNVSRKGLKADQMPPPLTFLPVVCTPLTLTGPVATTFLSLPRFFSFSSVLSALSLGFLRRFVVFPSSSAAIAIQGCVARARTAENRKVPTTNVTWFNLVNGEL